MENKTKLANIITELKETCATVMDGLKTQVAQNKATLIELYKQMKATSAELWEYNDMFEDLADTAENFAYDCDNLNEDLIEVIEQGADIVPILVNPEYPQDIEVVEVDEEEDDADTTHIDELKAN